MRLKNFVIVLVVVFSLLGAYQAYSFGNQLVTDYTEYRIIRNWAVQKINAETAQQQRQREEAARRQTVAPAAVPTPGAPSAAAAPPAAK